MDSIGEIRRRRRALGMSLGELARAVGRSEATLSRIERGGIRPSYELVQRIEGHLDSRERAVTPRLTAADVMTRDVVVVQGTAPLHIAARLMERHGISQMPVAEGSRVTGSVSESGLLRAMADGHGNGEAGRVREVQEATYPQVDVAFPADLLATMLARLPAVVVTRRGAIQGIVTKTDLLRKLRALQLREGNPG